MKVLLISNLYPPYARGGAERVVKQLADELTSAGTHVTVVTAAPWARVLCGHEVHEENGVRVYRVFHWNFVFQLYTTHAHVVRRALAHAWSLVNIFFAARVYYIIRAEQPDVVHTHNLAGTSFLIPFMLRCMHVPHVHTVHDVQLAIPSGRLLVGEEFAWINTGFPARVFQAVQKFLWGSPAVVTSPSAWLAQYYHARKYFRRSRVHVVRHIFSSHHGEKISGALFTIVYAGQLERAKGVLMLIRVCADLWSMGGFGGAELLIIGEGSDANTAELLAALCPAIHVIGGLPHERLLDTLRFTDCVVVPSLLYENSPTIIVEALAAGCPVAVSNIGGAHELVNNTNGWIVEPTEDAWRAHIQWVLTHRAEVAALRPHLSQTSNLLAEISEIYTRAAAGN